MTTVRATQLDSLPQRVIQGRCNQVGARSIECVDGDGMKNVFNGERSRPRLDHRPRFDQRASRFLQVVSQLGLDALAAAQIASPR